MKLYKSEAYIDVGQRIGIFSTKQTCREEQHRHEFIEVVYIQSGSAIQWINDTNYEVSQGDVVFINYDACHAFEPRGDFQYTNICFRPEVLSGPIITQDNALTLLSLTAFDDLRQDQSGGMISFWGQERKEVEFILACMLKEHQVKLPSSNRIMENYLSILLEKMLRKSNINNCGALSSSMWDELCSYIERNLGSDLSLFSLAQKCFYNPNYFSRLFKQNFGVSLSDYVRQKRIEHAMDLLRETNYSLDAIAEKIGYSERSAFYHTFSKQAGMTPLEYRKKVKGQHK